MNKSLMMVIAALLVIVGLVMSGYNNLVEMNENVNGKWSQIENQLQRRNDLIPNLVNTVKGYAAHESDVFKAVAECARQTGRCAERCRSKRGRWRTFQRTQPPVDGCRKLPAAAG